MGGVVTPIFSHVFREAGGDQVSMKMAHGLILHGRTPRRPGLWALSLSHWFTFGQKH